MITWADIDTVLLDMDGTLLDLHFDNYFWLEYIPRQFATKHGITHAEAEQQLKPRFETGVGTLDWYCLDHWSDQLQMDIPQLKREVSHMVKIRPYTLEFLANLRASGKMITLVTNAHRKTFDIKMAEVDITSWFDHIVVSHELGLPKEDITFWQALQDHCPYEPERTLLIDDTERVLESARAYGIEHLLTLLQPDSQQQKRLDTRFPGIHHFDEIMPPAVSE